MSSSLILSEHVINTIRALPSKERDSIGNALVREFILQEDPRGQLSAMENMLYAVIRFYVIRDRERSANINC